MKYVGNLGTSERVLADGRVIEPGVEFDLNKDGENDPHNQRLIAEGQINPVKKKTDMSSGGDVK